MSLKEEDKIPEKVQNETEISSLLEKEFKDSLNWGKD